MRTKIRAIAFLCLAVSACATGRGQEGVRDLEPRPIAPADDIVNQMQQTQVDGLVITLTIDSATVRLDTVVLASIPRPRAARDTVGDRVTVVGFAGGTRVSDVNVPDMVINAQEGVGIVRVNRRQITVLLPAPRALDTIEVTAPATNATGRLDVRAAYARFCPQFNADNRYCPRPR